MSEPKTLADLRQHFNKAVIVEIVGDAEAFLFDWNELSDAQRAQLIEHHLAAVNARLLAENRKSWTKHVQPFALIGHSLPPAIHGAFDLSAPHEGVLLYHTEMHAVLYCAAKDDERICVLYPEIAMLNPRPSYHETVYPTAQLDFAYAVDRGESAEFTLSQIELLMQMAGLNEIQFV